jgi:hypothetical protein
LVAGGLVRILCEGGIDHREHHLPLAFPSVRQCVSQEVHSAPLPRGFQHFRHCRLYTNMSVRDDQLHTAQPTAHQ